MKILTRYLLREHVGPFLAALGVLTVLMLINQLARRLGELAGKGLPAQVIAEVFGLSVPFILAMTIPMAVLVAVLYAFGRLSADNELTALKASGVGLRRLCVPVILGAAVVSVLTGWFSDRVVPESNHALRKLLVDIGQKKPTFNLREQMVNEVVADKLFLRAAKIDRMRNRLHDVVIHDVGARDLTRIIYADSGHLAFNESRTDLYLTLYDGTLYEVDFRDPNASQVAEFREHIVRAPGVQDELERGRGGEFRGDREMNVAMMRERVAGARAAWRAALDSSAALTRQAISIARAQPERATSDEEPRPRDTAGVAVPSDDDSATAATAEGAGGAGAPLLRKALLAERAREATAGKLPTPARAAAAAPSPGMDREPQERAARKAAAIAARYREHALRAQVERREMSRYLVEIHKKFAIPAAAIVFALIGAPIGSRFPRGGIGMVLLVSLLVFNVYYVGLIAGEDLADRGVIPPFWGMWAPNVLFLFLGLYLMYREGRQSATAHGGGWEELIDLVRRAAEAPLRRWRRRAGGAG